MITSGKERMKITVTQKIIDKSIPEDCGHCLIAEALRDKGASSVNVDAQYARFNIDGMRYIFPVPATAALQVILFDKAGSTAISPFKFRFANGFAKPIQQRNAHKKKVGSGPTNRKKVTVIAKHSKRRYHGIKMIELSSGQVLS